MFEHLFFFLQSSNATLPTWSWRNVRASGFRGAGAALLLRVDRMRAPVLERCEVNHASRHSWDREAAVAALPGEPEA